MNVICGACGKLAFTYLVVPKSGDTIRAEDALFDDGSHPVPGTDIRCQHCRAVIYPNMDGTSRVVPE